ncbi:MAG: Holliday junction resolvase RuvX [Nitrosomonas sp.]|jgi:putative Holliday junction resolvase|uniref:Putative pre-16S rRNA nuclease n=1 Tax=Nitrosomonas oligotropha TaxID=42354 RepID=A0A2T5I246_9PROT|nr:Holliday junction resolvase RuvX [Nitrosomonas oligotropha]MBK7492986.1 Holliday junction resolvase RuvX [Nitrosomonas sp.]MBP9100185.1 Holliday junction resolvase RuvX [Nitrosomonas sp.]PTQ77914.1 putative Holliday junction resolvase [Nitrosomonas oligotropha]TXI26956.1 MAG: Holliday junction resolvase RuvX [Nitrosomonas oligotropha]
MTESLLDESPENHVPDQLPAGAVLAFDFGKKRIGVAIGNTAVGVAHPLATVDSEVTERRFALIGQLIQTWQPVLLVVGLPLHSDGTVHELTQLSQRFARRLSGRFNIQVIMKDERYTSETASATLREAGITGRKQKAVLDQVAAQQILQSFFDEQYAITRR